MGQSPSNTSAHSNSVTPNRRRSFRSPFIRRKKHKHLLSATFQAPCSNNFEALNINTATVEQFMTLPGINRRIAQSIADHRFAIGGRFPRVDDLALVSGIGAEKLEQIRPEVCIKRSTRSNQGSSSSSRTPSLDSIFSEPNFSMQQKSVININTSSVFQLQQIRGMNQEIAANLVDYRKRKGPFKSLDELIKVRGFSHVRLGAIRSSLCVKGDDGIPKTPKASHTSSLSTCPTSTPIKNGYTNVGHRKSMSMPIKMNLGLTNGFANAPVNDIFDLLGAYSHRPVVEDNYNNTRNGHSSLRLASWNLDRMCFEKSSNLGVKEVICRTILENKLSILCLQEIIEPSALHNICEELNNPTLRRVREWKGGNHRNWKYFTNFRCSEQSLNGLGFIYDANICDVVRNECFDIPLDDCISGDKYLTPSAYLAAFKLSDWTCYILNTYLRYFDLENINKFIESVESCLKDDDSDKLTISDIFLVVGDFSGINFEFESAKYLNNSKLTKPKHKKANINFENLGFYNVVELNSTSFSREQPLNRPEIISSCNILCREKMPVTRSAFREALYKTKSPLTIYKHDLHDVPSAKGDKLCGHWGIVRQGLCHMAIPRGWTWGGPATEHCPIWIELYKRSDRLTSSKNNSVDTIDNNSVTGSQFIRRGSFNSNVSYRRMNGHGVSNSNLNASSDSVFLSNNN